MHVESWLGGNRKTKELGQREEHKKYSEVWKIRTAQKNGTELWEPAWGLLPTQPTTPSSGALTTATNPVSWMQLLPFVWWEPVPIPTLGLTAQALFPRAVPIWGTDLCLILIVPTPGDSRLRWCPNCQHSQEEGPEGVKRWTRRKQDGAEGGQQSQIRNVLRNRIRSLGFNGVVFQ